jgi:hypothetical protein
VPVSRKEAGAQMFVIPRVKNSAAPAPAVGADARDAAEVARVIERHDDHDRAAHDVDRLEARQ